MDAVRTDAGDFGRTRPALRISASTSVQGVAEGKGLGLGKAVLQRQILAFRAAPGAAQRRDEIERRESSVP